MAFALRRRFVRPLALALCFHATMACDPEENEDEAPIAAFSESIQIENGRLMPLGEGGLSSTMADGLVLELSAPPQLAPGQVFRLRVSSNYRGQPGMGTVVLHVEGAAHAIAVDAIPYPSPASALGIWSVDVHGKVGADPKLGGHSYDFDVALMSPIGQIGPIARWSVQIDDLPPVTGCPTVATCGFRECGRELLCGVSCGQCDPGTACNDSGICEVVGPACPAAADCTGRACGVDPICGQSCGLDCPTGLECSDAGQCVQPAGTTTGVMMTGTQTTLTGDLDTGAGTGTGMATSTGADSMTGDASTTGCTPDCSDRVCGYDPDCPTTSCGQCERPFECVEGACHCEAQCENRECGLDPICETSCGGCDAGETCVEGRCEMSIGCPDTMNCGDRECGPDPVCGLECGTCDDQQTCEDGRCIDAPTCPDLKDCSGRECGPDPVCEEDCGRCAGGQRCIDGLCIDIPMCPDIQDCTGLECGPDPLCNLSCGTCRGDDRCVQGECVDPPMCPDTKDCSGRECGPDPVCDLSCGQCDAEERCVQGVCVDVPMCPDIKDCTGLECGRNPVCGESCGECDTGSTCMSGDCVCDSPCTEEEPECVDGDTYRRCVAGCWRQADCGMDEFCLRGACECQQGFADCDGACIDPGTNETYCGVNADCSGGDTCERSEVCLAYKCLLQRCDGVLRFADPQLELAVRQAIDEPEKDLLHEDMFGLFQLQSIQCRDETERARSVNDLDGVQCLHQATSLAFRCTSIKSLEPLSSMPWLTNIYFGGTGLTDISPLQGLTNLTSVDLNSNRITDLGPLKDLVGLETLVLESNPIEDVSPLLDLTNLRSLDLRGIEIACDDEAQLENVSKLRSILTSNKGKLQFQCKETPGDVPRPSRSSTASGE